MKQEADRFEVVQESDERWDEMHMHACCFSSSPPAGPPLTAAEVPLRSRGDSHVGNCPQPTSYLLLVSTLS